MYLESKFGFKVISGIKLPAPLFVHPSRILYTTPGQSSRTLGTKSWAVLKSSFAHSNTAQVKEMLLTI